MNEEGKRKKIVMKGVRKTERKGGRRKRETTKAGKDK